MGSVVLYKATHAVAVPPFWTPTVRIPPAGTVTGALLPFTRTVDTTGAGVGAGDTTGAGVGAGDATGAGVGGGDATVTVGLAANLVKSMLFAKRRNSYMPVVGTVKLNVALGINVGEGVFPPFIKR